MVFIPLRIEGDYGEDEKYWSRTSWVWLSMRDYKVFHRVEDKMVCSITYEANTKDIKSFLIDTGMTIQRVNGRGFTKYSRFSYALVNVRWLLFMQPLEVQVMNPECSDYSHLCVTLRMHEDIRHKPLMFWNHIVKHEKFQRIVQRLWQQRHSTCTLYEVW